MMDDLSKSKSVYLFTERHLPPQGGDTGAANLLSQHGLEKAYDKYCHKKVKETLSHFLPDLPGIVNMGATENYDSSLRSLIDPAQPQIVPKEIAHLSATQMESFRLQSNGFRLGEKTMEELNATARKAKKKSRDKAKDRSRDKRKKSEKKRSDKSKKREKKEATQPT